MICPICDREGKTSKVKFVGHKLEEIPWDYDEEGNLIERAINVKIECSGGHRTDARLRSIIERAEES